jgi:hypothetical protein|tara:strand:+ start:6170 stop:7102 length:933 start_codon:yes stop_codon:yes gene_type:complete
MEFFTAQDRSAPITIENRAISIPACGNLPFFFGNRRSLEKGILVSHSDDIFYRLSNYELVHIRKAFFVNSKAILTAPFDKNDCDSWFLRLDKNKMIVTENFVVSTETARILLHFGGVMDEKGDFTFKTINKAYVASEYIIARRKVKKVIAAKNSINEFLKAEHVKDKSILIVNPSDFVTSEIEDLASTNMVDFVEPSGNLAKQLVSKGGVFKGHSIYELSIKNKYDFIVFAGDTKDVNELVPRSVRHLRATGKLAFISPSDYRNVANRFTQRLIAITGEFSKKLNASTEVTLINRYLISNSHLEVLLKAS